LNTPQYKGRVAKINVFGHSMSGMQSPRMNSPRRIQTSP
jgi:hypothetical protein